MSPQIFIGNKYGRLTVISVADPLIYIYKNGKNTRYRVECKCDCGNEKVIDLGSILSGRSTSCGCYNRESATKRATKHGLCIVDGKKRPEYVIWSKMKHRCLSINDKRYKDYGGRGITVCDEWISSFENFISDMGFRPSKNHSLERVDNDGNYEPLNCKWATREEQARNTRRVKLIEYNDEKLCLTDWCKKLHLSYSVMRRRVYELGIPFNEAILLPPNANCIQYLREVI